MPRLTSRRKCFNPLVIGSIFQTLSVLGRVQVQVRRFQSPSNRVNIPNEDLGSGVVNNLTEQFQSPSNRVNIPNEVIESLENMEHLL